MSDIVRFSSILIAMLAIVFCIHYYILNTLNFDPFENKMVLSYLVNVLLAIAIYVFLVLMKDKYSSQLGFLFLFGSALKFLVFFLVFYPAYKADGNINKLEFTAFFVPYLICLIYETFCLSKWLNKIS